MPHPTFSSHLLRRVVLPIGGAAVFAGLSFAQGFASAAGTSSLNEIVGKIAPWHAKTKARTAEIALVAGIESGRVRMANDLAREVLQRDPTNVVALRTMGLASQAAGRTKDGARQLVLAEKLTRRDLPSQFYAIEDAVARNDLVGALRHYDIAMRVNRESWPILMPVLVAATSNAEVIPPLAAQLAKRPQWADVFLAELLLKGTSAPNALLLTNRLSTLGQPVSKDILSGVYSNLVTQKSWPLLAERALALRRRYGERTALVTDGDFNHLGALRPIDWTISSDGNAAVQSGPGKSSGPVLAFSLTPGLETELARQVLVLSPGSYVISARTGTLDGAQAALAYFRMDCADGGGQRLLDRQNAVRSSQTISATFNVPQGCGGQWLQIRAKSPDVESSSGWIDDIRISRQ